MPKDPTHPAYRMIKKAFLELVHKERTLAHLEELMVAAFEHDIEIEKVRSPTQSHAVPRNPDATITPAVTAPAALSHEPTRCPPLPLMKAHRRLLDMSTKGMNAAPSEMMHKLLSRRGKSQEALKKMDRAQGETSTVSSARTSGHC